MPAISAGVSPPSVIIVRNMFEIRDGITNLSFSVLPGLGGFEYQRVGIPLKTGLDE